MTEPERPLVFAGKDQRICVDKMTEELNAELEAWLEVTRVAPHVAAFVSCRKWMLAKERENKGDIQ